MESIALKKVTPGEVVELQEISRKTFVETFSGSNTESDMAKYLEEGFSVEKLFGELNSEQSEFYFARLNGEVVAYLKLNFGLEANEGVEIQRIYVLQAYHGKKVGQLLYEKALEIAAKRQAPYIWLGVWEENPRAIRFYQKNGFVEFDKHIFKLGDDEQTDIVMKKIL